jgi:hypothetical protein
LFDRLGAERARVKPARSARRGAGSGVIAGEHDDWLSTLNLAADDAPKRVG